MTITREEFKKLVEISTEVNELVDKACEFMNEDKVCRMAFPFLMFIEEKLQIDEEHTGADILWELGYHKPIAIDWDVDPNGYCCNITYSNDLDKIYDKYLAPKAANN